MSKKEYVCQKCGKTFVKRINLNGDICDDCLNAAVEQGVRKSQMVEGYKEYGKKVLSKSYTDEEIDRLIARKESLMQKYRNQNGITMAELQQASDNYKKLTDEQAMEVTGRIVRTTITATMGAAEGRGFFVLSHYGAIIVDAADIFAVGYTTLHGMNIDSREAILCVIFTNDPYVPVFPVVYSGELGFFEVFKSKKGRAGIAEQFERICPNLTYPVTDIKELKKTIKGEGSVRGNVDMNFMLDKISDAGFGSGMFNVKNQTDVLTSNSKRMLEEMGYLMDADVMDILKYDKMFNKKYWEKKFNQYYVWAASQIM